MTSSSDIGADTLVRTERPPDAAGRSVWADIGYIFRLVAFHFRRDPLLAATLWALVLGGAAAASYVSLLFFQELAHMTNYLVSRDRGGVVDALYGAAMFAALVVTINSLEMVFTYFLRIRIRAALTTDLLNRWIEGPSLYRPDPEAAPDHPEQRVQEDVYSFCLFILTLLPLLVGSVTSFWIYSAQLWQLSDAIAIPFPFGNGLVVPKGLYVVAILLAAIMTIVTHLVGRNVTRLEVVRQRLEAGFRHDLGQMREFAQQIVLSEGQQTERSRAAHDFTLIKRNWTPFTIASSFLHGAIGSSAMLKVLIPNALLFPLVLEGRLQVGDLAIAVLAFQTVYQTFANGATLYETFMPLNSAAQRIGMLDRAVSTRRSTGFDVRAGDPGALALRDLHVRTVDGRELFSLGTLRFGAGERWLVRGMSGSGKSTFFRVLAGMWPFGSGTVERPGPPAKAMFLPQVPYLPNGTVGELLSYPREVGAFTKEAYRQALVDARLERLVGEIDTPHAWAKSLSPGEQQRVVLARALLQRPDFLFLDEATSSLDPKTEAAVFEALVERLPRSTIVTIAHTDGPARYHDRLLSIEDGKAVAGELHPTRARPAGRSTRKRE